MPIKPGTRLGTYEILSQIGAGGMGEVYKARDLRLDRLVAIKVLPASLATDLDLVGRFEREAKAVAALSHPNILGIHDFGTQGGITYAVMELLEGETLRDKLRLGGLIPKRAMEIATELALGLSAAHERGIIHRDVKPENIFLTREGRVKILDFGLAKQITPSQAALSELATEVGGSAAMPTQAGTILGTVGYLSPEQVRGEPADHRSDLFAFGVVLHEMVNGQRPFQGASQVQTMTAILEKEPPALVPVRGCLPPALERLVAHCLEKRPEARFQSMKDLAFALQNLSTMTSALPGQPMGLRPDRWRWLGIALAGAAAMLLLVSLFRIRHWPPFSRPTQPTFTRVSFALGTVDSALFGPDGRTIYFSQRLQGGPPELFVIPSNAVEPRPLGIRDAVLLGVSTSNELAILHSPRPWYGDRDIGTLAQVNGGGGAIKEIQENVVGAAWDDQGLAIGSSDETETQVRLEFPVGRTALQGDAMYLVLGRPRLSRDGSFLAVVLSDNVTKSEIVLLDRGGGRKVIFTKLGDLEGDTLTGLAWGPEGDLWCSELQGDQTAVWSITPSGKQQLRWRVPGNCELADLAPDGRMLLIQHHVRRSVTVQEAGGKPPKDASVLGGTQALGLSDDGRTLLLLESPIMDGGSSQDLAFARKMDGSPAIRLGRGVPQTLSRDGRWMHLRTDALTPRDLDPAILAAYQKAGLDPKVALDARTHQCHLVLVPIEAGRPVVVPLPLRFEQADFCMILPKATSLLFSGNEKGHQSRWYVMDRLGGEPRAFSPEGYGVEWIGMNPLSPDGKLFIVSNGKTFSIQPLDGGPLRPVLGVHDDEAVIRWAEDGKSLFVRNRGNGLTAIITRLDPVTGVRQPVLRMTLPDPAGFQFFRSVIMTPDARTFAFTFSRKLSELYVVEGGN